VFDQVIDGFPGKLYLQLFAAYCFGQDRQEDLQMDLHACPSPQGVDRPLPFLQTLIANRPGAQHRHQAATRVTLLVQADRRRQRVSQRARLTEAYTPRLITATQVALYGTPPIPVQGDGAEGAGHDTQPAAHAEVTIHDHGTGIWVP
jgi:hypothetical protein